MQLRSYDVTVARDDLTAAEAVDLGPELGYDTHRVTVLHADQLVAEQAGPRYGLQAMTAQPMTWATLWCWTALQRSGVSVPEFPLFKTRVLDLELVKDPQGEEGMPLDPMTPHLVTDSP